MNSLLGVDLAARMSAAVLLGDDLEVKLQFNSLEAGNTGFCTKIFDTSSYYGCPVLIEDLPPLRRFDLPAKEACILQGRILQLFQMAEMPGRLFWLQPLKWMKYFGYEKKIHKTTANFAKLKCEELGYTPPEEARGKQLQDYRDAYLISRYGVERRVWAA